MLEESSENVGGAGSTAFVRALEEYINKPRSARSKTPQFLKKLQEQQRSGSNLTGDAIKKDLFLLDRQATDRTAARAARKILGPVIQVLNTYSGIVETLVSADPMPTAIIWGCLKSVIDCSQRFLELYEKISDQIKRLNTHITVLTEYEDLFDHSATMRELLQASYIDIIRFWRRVDKECNRCVANRAFRAIAPFSTEKLDGIITSIGDTADSMSRLIPAVQERLDRGERENAAEERRLAGIAREEQAALIQMYAEEMEKRKEERRLQRQEEVRKWLRDGTMPLNGSNFRHRDSKLAQRSPGTCDWVFEHATLKDWMDKDSPASQVWVKASPGAGKTVLTASVVEKLEATSAENVAVIYHYFTFDEEFPALLVYRCLAEQIVNRLGKQTGDVPKDIHKFTQEGATTANVEDVKQVIRMLLEEMAVTYIFLDGLDEECETENRKKELCKVLEFFGELSRAMPSRLRIWYSSQHRTCLDAPLSSLPSIEITKELNSHDIEHYLLDKIEDLKSLEFDAGYIRLIIGDLREKADGCFLWASLMLDSMSDAVTLHKVQSIIEGGLPDSYEKYYQRKMDSIRPGLKEFASIILSCIVHAKRPLRLDELCECTAMVKGIEGQNIDRSQKIKKSKVLELCQPLVQIHESDGPAGTISICTLTHGSVKNFLLKNPGILANNSKPPAYALTNDVLANVCLKYLLQPRYQQLLTREGETFVDCDGEDILNHHLLSYAAKYWDKHLDGVNYSLDYCQKASSFIRSPQFFTLLQVQSLFVDGQFRFWYSTYRPWAGRHIKRVFPHWLDDNCNEPFAKDYASFVGEWGPLLDRETSITGAFAGEVDRCFPGALGPNNYLHKGPSRYRSLMFTAETEPIEPPIRCFEGVDETGRYLTVLNLEKVSEDRLQFCCEHWHLNGRKPELRTTQKLYASASTWSLYEYPLTENVPGRPRLVSFTKDLKFMRIGSQLFVKGVDHDYTSLPVTDPDEDYFDEMASNNNMVAVSTRRHISKSDVEFPGAVTGDVRIVDYADIAIQKREEEVSELDQRSTAAPTSAADTQPTTTVTKSSDDDSDSGTIDTDITSESSLKLEDPDEFQPSTEKDKALELATKGSNYTDELMKSSSESAGNSAYTSWSEGSTDLDDEVEDEEEWNDWDLENLELEELDIEEKGSFLGSDNDGYSSGDERKDALKLHDDLASELSESDNASDALEKRSDMLPSDSDGSDVESVGSSTNYSVSSSEYGSDDENRGILENMMTGNKTTSTEGTRRTSIRVYDASRKERIPVFHFTCFIKDRLFDSPPVFHPSKPLLVWPLGDREILFANYEKNTYFTRGLCRSGYGSCHIFIKAHFSSDGRHLHLAALEAREAAKSDKEEASVLLSLQVSTHRLSEHKTASSPPRMIFRTTVELGNTPKLSVSNLPHFLTWSDTHLFFTSRNNKLDVLRIPLFRFPGDNVDLNICSLQEPIFLPRSVEARNMYFFPSQETTKKTSRKKDTKSATLILGAQTCLPSQGILVPRHMCYPPIAVFLREDKDLVWACKSNVDEGRKINNACGRLRGKFESFDHNEDCDIIPYLF
ncbi:vegetative incompatibility protein HET-E-1 [Aspergillus tubingensis]|uniref:vegetative incompatibility protein HET-E-1 n=1 Tax=Aspergillus tubingensis TaxID=5068 RepID=UPI001578D95D|nr:vegetative incompatibility protein HET-E-1 [Aspergillus tubingensis]GFN16881.1 vegetative incompatibility protein HET-E-1 [Aspergillus tubingensis]GLA92328.1 hypothetical protein AtubIFM57143_007846 [Aspergillus tubingensis]